MFFNENPLNEKNNEKSIKMYSEFDQNDECQMLKHIFKLYFPKLSSKTTLNMLIGFSIMSYPFIKT